MHLDITLLVSYTSKLSNSCVTSPLVEYMTMNSKPKTMQARTCTKLYSNVSILEPTVQLPLIFFSMDSVPKRH